MNLAEWHAVLAATPATPNQVGAVHGEFRRLGFGPDDRPARLAISAAMLGLDDLGSTTDLVMGQAGYLVRALRGFGTRAELTAAAGQRRPAPSAGPGSILAAVRSAALAMAGAAC